MTNPVTIRTMTAYVWSCSVCGDSGSLESSEEMARESGYEHEHSTDDEIGDKTDD